MEWRIGICGTPSKNFSKKFEKPLDNHLKVWYNVSVKQRSPKQDRPIERRKKFFGKAEKGLDKRPKL